MTSCLRTLILTSAMALALGGFGDDQAVDLVLRPGTGADLFPDVDAVCVAAGKLKHLGVDQPVVEVEPLGIHHTTALGKHPRPGDREAG